MSDHRTVIEEHRSLREALETSVLPLATSVDGYRFEYQASLHGLELEAGGYVAIDAGGETGSASCCRFAWSSTRRARSTGRAPS